MRTSLNNKHGILLKNIMFSPSYIGRIFFSQMLRWLLSSNGAINIGHLINRHEANKHKTPFLISLHMVCLHCNFSVILCDCSLMVQFYTASALCIKVLKQYFIMSCDCSLLKVIFLSEYCGLLFQHMHFLSLILMISELNCSFILTCCEGDFIYLQGKLFPFCGRIETTENFPSTFFIC